jgi:hypothetical protein
MSPTYAFGNWLYLRILGLCAMTAFASMYSQAPGLIGSRGLTPVAQTMADLAAARGGIDWLHAPTVFWWSTADWFVQAVFATGVAAGALLMLGIAPRVTAAVAYLVVLSVRATEGGGFRWFNAPYDNLFAECLFIGIWLAPLEAWSSPLRPRAPSRWARWLVLWVLFRLIAGTGVTKVVLGGAWFDLDAVQHFLVAQPFPMAAAAAMYHGPLWLLQASCLFTLACEVLAPWFFWWPGRPARIAAYSVIVLNLGIHAFGNLRGFNWLNIGLVMLLFDDAWWLRISPLLRARLKVVELATAGRLARAGACGIVAAVAVASFEPLALQAGYRHDELPLPAVHATLRPFHLSSNYYMFCSVPPERYGLVIQGSDDGEQWRDYQPYGLPGAVDHWPERIAPGNDHLGFQMWLCAFGPPHVAAGWLPRLLQCLLDGEADIRALFAHDPFPDQPPRHARAARFLFTFAPADERASGILWRRQLVDVYGTACR